MSQKLSISSVEGVEGVFYVQIKWITSRIFFFQTSLYTTELRVYLKSFDNMNSYLIGWVIMEILSWDLTKLLLRLWGFPAVGLSNQTWYQTGSQSLSLFWFQIKHAAGQDEQTWTHFVILKEKREKGYERQTSESKQSEVKLGTKFGAQWRLFTGRIRGFVTVKDQSEHDEERIANWPNKDL